LCPNLSRVAGEIHYVEPIDSGDEQYRYEVHLLVRDAGAGFDVEEAKANRGLGLVCIRKMVNLVLSDRSDC
jgi:signal transduction histidine kinase